MVGKISNGTVPFGKESQHLGFVSAADRRRAEETAGRLFAAQVGDDLVNVEEEELKMTNLVNKFDTEFPPIFVSLGPMIIDQKVQYSHT